MGTGPHSLTPPVGGPFLSFTFWLVGRWGEGRESTLRQRKNENKARRGGGILGA